MQLSRASRRVRLAAWRTLRRRVGMVSITPDGQEIVVIDGARLVLPPGARHFRQFVNCSNCGDDFVSAAVLHADQLGRPLGLVCGRCLADLH